MPIIAQIFTNENLDIKNKGFFLRKNKEKEGKFGDHSQKDALPLLRDVNHIPEKCARLLKERSLLLEDYLLLPDDHLLMINDWVRLLRDDFIEEDDNRLVVNDWVLLMEERVVVLRLTPRPHSLEPLYIFYKNHLSYYLKYYLYLYSEIRTLHYLSECLNCDLCDSFDFVIGSTLKIIIIIQIRRIKVQTSCRMISDYQKKIIMEQSIIKEQYKYSELTSKIIGCAMTVHKVLGNGFQEVIYQRAMAIEMRLAGISFSREHDMPVFFREEQIGTRRVDFLVEGVVSTELKAISVLDNTNLNQAINYLEAYNLEVGLLINFGENSLKFKRLLNKKYKLV